MPHREGGMMKPFVYKNFCNDFFEVLHTPIPPGKPPGITTRCGATARQDAAISVLSGDLTLEYLPEFASSLRGLLTGTVRLIVLDLSRITVFCPNAASVLVNFVSFVEGGGKRLVLFRPSHSVRALLDSLHLTHLFEIHLSEEELLLALPD